MRKKTAALITALAFATSVLVVGVAWLYDWLQQPVGVRPASPALSAVQATQTTRIQTPYFESVVDGVYTIKQQTTSTGVIRASLVLSRADGQQLACTVAVLPSGGLAESAAVRLRKQQTTAYEPLELAGVPAGGVAFRANATSEISVFVPHDGLYASFVLSGGKGQSLDYAQQMTAILRGLQWRDGS